jgi:hypothetical protein
MSRHRPQKEKREAPPEPKKPEPEIPEAPDNNSKEEIKPKTPPPETGLIEALFKDKEKSIILALILLLSDTNNDPSMLLALAYLLI